MKFKLVAPFSASGDQPEAIEGISRALREGVDAVTLLGVTGSGKTFTMASVIEKILKRTSVSTTRLTNCGSVPPRPLCRAAGTL